MKKTVVIFILSMLAWSVVAQERDYAADARRAFEEGRYADAVKLYDAAYVFDGKDYSPEKETASQCLTKMLEAIAAVNVNQVEDAVAAYKFVLSKNPKDPMASEYVRMHENENIKIKTHNDNANGYINGYGYVDLGLPSGLKWATCNVGASNAEDYGGYYAWGETETKTWYDEDNSVTQGKKLSKLHKVAIINSSNLLALSYDTARANWGGSWRIPTKEEWEELLNNCTCTWSILKGIGGYVFVGLNGNSIFLPAAGFRQWMSLSFAGENGLYWSSTAYEGSSNAYEFYFSNYGCGVSFNYRYIGSSIRPVSK